MPAPIRTSPPDLPSRDLALRDHYDKALFFGFYNEMADELLPTLPLAAQVLYSRLFRLSYGFNRNYCTVSQPLLMERTGLSRNTLRTALQVLLDADWVVVVGAGNRVSTTYRVILPRERRAGERQGGMNVAPQNLTVKNRPPEFDGQNKSLTRRESELATDEGQKSAPRILTVTQEESSNYSNNKGLETRLSKFDAQDLTPLLLTNRSITPSQSEPESPPVPAHSLLLSARELTDKFYSLLGLRVAKSKRKKSLDECLNLLHEGFTVEEIDYAISWLVTHHPTTGSFARLPHFIDQALKVRELQRHTHHDPPPERHQLEEVRHTRQQEHEEVQRQQRIEAVIASLAPEDLAALREDAEKRVGREYPDIKFGRDTLVRLTLEELITTQFLPQPSETEGT